MKVLIIRPPALGDTLMLMPAIVQLKASVEISLVGRYPGIYFLSQYVHHCIDYEGPGWHGLFLRRMDNASHLSIPQAHRIVAFLRDPEGNVSNNLKAKLPSASVHLFPAFPPKGEKIHVAFYLAQCLQKAGLPIDPMKSLDEAFKRSLLEEKSPSVFTGRIILHPGSGGQKKNLPPDFWLKMIKAFSKTSFSEKGQLTLLLGPAEEQVHSFYRKNLGQRDAEMLFSPDKEELVSLLRQTSLYVGHDSGITHLAAMLGTPTIALFKNSSVYQWRPLGPAVKVIKVEESSQGLITSILREGDKLAPFGAPDAGC